MATLDAIRMQDIETRYPELLRRSAAQRFGGLLMVIGTLLYVIYASWFFDLPKLVAEAHWERFGIYMIQWVSYDVQPDFRIEDDGTIKVKYSRFSVLGDNPHPAWVRSNADGSVSVDIGGTVDISKAATVVHAHGTDLKVDVTSGAPKVIGPVPDWVTVYPDTVLVDLGLAGDISIDVDRVKVRKRFFGWANFLFDTRSPFFDKPLSEVMAQIWSGPRIDPEQSNLSLAFDNIWNNNAWQHGDVWTKLFETIVMAFLGTLLGALAAFPLSFLAARNITSSGLVNHTLKRFFDFLRSVDMLIWALFLTRAFGPGPLAGSGAIFLTEAGTLGKLYSEGLENIDNKPREGMRSVGAPPVAVQRYGVVPQIIPVLVSQTLYQWESNVRGATIIGAVGAGGIGLKLWEAMRTNSNWENVAYMVLLIFLVVYMFDNASSYLRTKLIGSPSR
jgi:phosphonate transport system permease protein